jgi:hypothetical protein
MPAATTASMDAAIVELRQYTLRAGRRDDLIELFERRFIASQEALGIELLGQFRDLDDPHRFVWLRGFSDMAARAESLAAFYGGPVWRVSSADANATMLDSDNVLLLQPAADARITDLCDRVPAALSMPPPGLVTISIQYLTPETLGTFARFFTDAIAPAMTLAGATICARFQTAPVENTFPALPVREGETAFVWIARFADGASYIRYLETLERNPDWRASATEAEFRAFARRPEVLRLVPTPRSRFR